MEHEADLEALEPVACKENAQQKEEQGKRRTITKDEPIGRLKREHASLTR